MFECFVVCCVAVLIGLGYSAWKWHESKQIDVGALSVVITEVLAHVHVMRAAASMIDELHRAAPNASDTEVRDRLIQLTGDWSWMVKTVSLARHYPGGATAFIDSLARRYVNARDAIEAGDTRRAVDIVKSIEREATIREVLRSARERQ